MRIELTRGQRRRMKNSLTATEADRPSGRALTQASGRLRRTTSRAAFMVPARQGELKCQRTKRKSNR